MATLILDGVGQGGYFKKTSRKPTKPVNGYVPPHVLKFDMQLIRGIDKAACSRQELLATLVRIAQDLGATPLAEGVETQGEHATCCQLGFQLGQGYHYSRPHPLFNAVRS